MHLLNFFKKSIDGFGLRLEGETICEGFVRRSGEKVLIYAAFLVWSSCMKVDTTRLCRLERKRC